MKFELCVGSVRKYKTRFFQLDIYLLYSSLDAGWSVVIRPKRYNEFEKRELLEVALDQPHKDKLKQMGRNE